MNSEFNVRPEAAAVSESQFWHSMEELLPIFEREGKGLGSSLTERLWPLPWQSASQNQPWLTGRDHRASATRLSLGG
jgi:hypothetical protein